MERGMSQQQEYAIDADKINFVEGSGAEDRIPESWNSEHVARRLVDAFSALDRCPRVRGPRTPGNAWPLAMPGEWLDGEPAPDDRPRQRRLAPTGIELARMDAALDWLLLLRQTDSGMALVVGLWAYNAARGRSIKELCRRKSWALHTFYRKRSKALALIAQYLDKRGTPVF
jgi:hypothetical protein